jgi:hypothetical protein
MAILTDSRLPWNDLNDSQTSWNDIKWLMSDLEWSELTHERPGKTRRSEWCTGCRTGAWRADSWAQWLCRPHGHWPIGTCETGEWISAVTWQWSGRNLLSISVHMWIKWSQYVKSVKLLSLSKHNPYISACRIRYSPRVCHKKDWHNIQTPTLPSECYFLVHDDLLTHYTNCYWVVAL